jgi:hypothetical protein
MRFGAVEVNVGRVRMINEGTDSTAKPPPRTRTWGMKRSNNVESMLLEQNATRQSHKHLPEARHHGLNAMKKSPY